jgi:hypothetical protein
MESANMEQVTFIHAFNGFLFFHLSLTHSASQQWPFLPFLKKIKLIKKTANTQSASSCQTVVIGRGSEDHLSRYGVEFLIFFVCVCSQ